MNRIRGVNLGGWLVLEKWICDDVFAGTNAEDDGELADCLPAKELEKRLKQHRDTFIQESDIETIAGFGLNMLRLPIPHTLFGDEKHSPCDEYVDRLFDWASRFGLKIILDLHTVPGGQNGLDNSGVTGLCTWHKDQKKVEKVLALLEQIAARYASKENLYGIELLNEPTSKERFESLKRGISEKYKARIEQSEFVPTTFLVDFYTECYARLAPYLREDQKIIAHDGFRLDEWGGFLYREDFPKLVFDTHMYLNFISGELKENTSRYYADFIFSRFLKELEEASKHHPILVGEWTLAHHQGDQAQMNQDMYKNYMKAICSLQKMAYEISEGWIYFNYKVKDKTRLNWDLSHVIAKGFFERID